MRGRPVAAAAMVGGGVALALALAGVAYAAGSLLASGGGQDASPSAAIQVDEASAASVADGAGDASEHVHVDAVAAPAEESGSTEADTPNASSSGMTTESAGHSHDEVMPEGMPDGNDLDGGPDMMQAGGEMAASDHEHDAGDAVTFDGTPPKSHRPPTKPTAEELACLSDLTAQAKEATLRLQDPSFARAEGYRFSDDQTVTHMPNPAYNRDGTVLDLSHPESAIYRLRDDGSYKLVGVLYKALKGQGPQPCGNATWWHTHTHCRDDATGKPLDMPGDQACPAGSTAHEGRVEMMHLWFVPRGQRR